MVIFNDRREPFRPHLRLLKEVFRRPKTFAPQWFIAIPLIAIELDEGNFFMTRTSIRAFLLRIHFYGGMFVGPFILVAALTGCLYAIAPTLENITYRDSIKVAEVEHPVTLEKQVAAAEHAHPGLDVVQVWPANTPTDATRVLLADPSIGEEEDRAVFVNPADASVIDSQPTYSGLGELPLRHWISALHQDFHLGKPGELYSELAASWLWVLGLGGLYLWFIRARAARLRRGEGALATLKGMLTGGAKGVAPQKETVLKPTEESEQAASIRPAAVAVSGTKSRAASRKKAMKIHAVAGTWLIVALLGLSATGITWSGLAGENVNKFVAAMNWKAKPIETSLHSEAKGNTSAAGSGHEGHEGHEGHGDQAGSAEQNESSQASDIPAAQADTVYRAARDAGLTGPLRLYPPEDEHSGWQASERWVEWRTTSDEVSVDGSNGRIIDRQDFKDLPTFSKLSNWGIYLHMGIMFGLPLQLLLLCVGLGIALMVIMGYSMWWKRRPNFVPGSPKTFSWQTTLLGVVVATVGVFLPLFGITLALFLLVDVIVMNLRARKNRSRGAKISATKRPESAITVQAEPTAKNPT